MGLLVWVAIPAITPVALYGGAPAANIWGVVGISRDLSLDHGDASAGLDGGGRLETTRYNLGGAYGEQGLRETCGDRLCG